MSFVSALSSARKNLETAFEAYALLKSRGVEHRLVVVGPKAWRTQGIFQRLERLGLADHVTFTGFVDDVDLPAIYAGADCFVFPSLYEGFGLPPLEAMACGTPVVVSNSSSLPEVTGDAALAIKPLDAAGFADAIFRILTDPTLAKDLRARGIISRSGSRGIALRQIMPSFTRVLSPRTHRRAYEWPAWSKLDVTPEQAFVMAIARSFVFRKIPVPRTT